MFFVRDTSPSEVKDQVDALAAAGVQRVMLNWARFDDLQGIRDLAKAVM